MALTSDLISQFVKITNDEVETKTETLAYGTIVEYNDVKYVQLDGSDLLTPISTTTDTVDGERVTVLIKDHSAIVTGNISSPSARTTRVEAIGNQITEAEILIAGKVSTIEFDAEVGRIDDLQADNVLVKERLFASEADIDELEANNATISKMLVAHEASIDALDVHKLDADDANIYFAKIENIQATNLNVHNLEADYGSFKELATGNFTAINADIQTLETEKLSATDAELTYANIDFANIDIAAVQQFYAVAGIIENIVISSGVITGELVGVTIRGDLIEGGTVKADKLVVLGEDGLYYKLNTDGITVEAQQTEYNSLNGSMILANTITASKINVDDLVAFDATIGGFNITNSAIHSGTKSTVDNTTRGLYLGNDGQFAFGDGTNYLKYYLDPETSTYKLIVSADSLIFSSTNESVETAINTLQEDVDTSVGNLAQDISSSRDEAIDASNGYAEGLLEGYTTADTFTEFRERTEAQFSQTSDEIELKFATNVTTISNVNDDFQSRFETMTKYFRFGVDGIEIGSTENPIHLEIDNDMIKFVNNGIVKGWWDGTNFHTGNIEVEVNEKAQFGNFAFVPRADGSLSLLKVGDISNNIFNIFTCIFETNVVSHNDIGSTGSVVTVSSATESAIDFTLDPTKTYNITYSSVNAGFSAYDSDLVIVHSEGTDGVHSATFTNVRQCYFYILSTQDSMVYTVQNIKLTEV